jgi:hypothetical protein
MRPSSPCTKCGNRKSAAKPGHVIPSPSKLPWSDAEEAAYQREYRWHRDEPPVVQRGYEYVIAAIEKVMENDDCVAARHVARWLRVCTDDDYAKQVAELAICAVEFAKKHIDPLVQMRVNQDCAFISVSGCGVCNATVIFCIDGTACVEAEYSDRSEVTFRQKVARGDAAVALDNVNHHIDLLMNESSEKTVDLTGYDADSK